MKQRPVTHFTSHVLDGKKLKSIFVVWISIQLLCSCASTNRSKTLITMSLVGLAAGAVGALTAPQNEQAALHGAFWGTVGAAASGAAGMYIFDEQSKSEDLEKENLVLKKTLDALRGDSVGAEQKLLYQTSAPIGKEVPTEYRNLVKPGRWSVYQLNSWVEQGENTIVHQDRMMRLDPPALAPNVLEPKIDKGENHEPKD